MEENIAKTKISGKNPKLRPLTGRAKPSLKNNIQNINNQNIEFKKYKPIKSNQNNDKLGTKVITESLDENENEINIIKDQLVDKDQFLEALGEDEDKDAFDKILTNEIIRIKNINDKKTKLKDINLIEKNYDDLYDWINLFNNSRPLSSYTTLKKPKLSIKEDNKVEEFKSPVVLVDLLEDQMNLYFGKNQFLKTESEDSKFKIRKKLLIKNMKKSPKKSKSKNINNNNKNNKNSNSNKPKLKSNSNNFGIRLAKKTSDNLKSQSNPSSKTLFHKHIRPMSVYSPRVGSFSFYFSSAFSDYYKEDLKSFSEKMKILKAKIKSNPNKLNHEIKNQRIISSKKERELNKILSLEHLNLEKQDLITAADRRNPVPLLKSIFMQKYPGKEVIKEHIKLYFNTMKPMGNVKGPIDYTQNDRWRLSEQIAEMREGKKHPKLKLDTNGINNDYSYLKSSSFFSSNNKTRNKPHNLILSYYNKDDPYIQMFENIINTKAKNNNIKVMKEADINELNQKRNFNPILESFKDYFSEKLDLKKINEQEEIKTKEKPKEKIEETIPQKDIEKNITKTVSSDNNNNIKINENKEIRPKTGFKSVATGVNNWFKRPLTSIFKRYDISYLNQDRIEEDNKTLQNYYQISNENMDYMSSNSFPLKTISNVGNVSYDKINQMLQERKFGAYKLKYDYFVTSTGQINKVPSIPKKKYNEEKIIFSKNYNFKENNKWSESFNRCNIKKRNKVNYYNFDNIIGNELLANQKEQKENLFALNYFKNVRGKYYSSSNNVNVKNKRNNKLKMLNSIFNESRYSKDDPDMELVDKAVSSQTESSFRNK